MKLKKTLFATLALAVAAPLGIAAPANAATVSNCKIVRQAYDSHYSGKTHGHIYAYVNYNWFEEVVLGQRDGVKYYGTTPASKIGTRPTWINGC